MKSNEKIQKKHKMCGPLENESCGWPRGTVRATIALVSIPIGFASAITIMIILIIQKQYEIALGINNVVWVAIGTILGYYFGSKKNKENINQHNNQNPNQNPDLESGQSLLENDEDDYMPVDNGVGATGTNFNEFHNNLNNDVNIEIEIQIV